LSLQAEDAALEELQYQMQNSVQKKTDLSAFVKVGLTVQVYGLH
jgi:hypothetical protein